MKNHIDMNKIELSFDETHHTYNGKPLYNRKFRKVMNFHPPGIAAVEDETGAYHIDLNGNPIYPQKYLKTYGFYEGIATVVDKKGYFHINLKGEPVHNNRFDWAGNFQEGRCVVRNFDGSYYHIKRDGTPAYKARYKYVGDFKYGIAVVYNDDGLATHIDKYGNLIHGRYFLELGVYHKGYAVAKDHSGYFHIDKKGKQLYSERFAWIENFYNDCAFAKLFDGRLAIIDTKGKIVREIASWDSVMVIEHNRRELMNKLVGYWQTQIIYSIAKIGILDYIESGADTKEKLLKITSLPESSLDLILDYLLINKMVVNKDNKYTITAIGKLLTENLRNSLKYAAIMWGEEHYVTMGYLINSLKEGIPQFSKLYGKNFFEYLEDFPSKNLIYQKAMEVYSMDYDALINHFDIPKDVETLMDVGGGHGRLSIKLLSKYPHLEKVIIFDLPEVISVVKDRFEKHEKLEFISGNFFQNIPIKADAVVMARVLHDWDDQRCIRILNNIKNSLSDNGLLYIVESIVPEKLNGDCGISLNFNLLVMVGGKERKLVEFAELFDATGFKIERIFERPNCSPSLIVLRKEKK